MWVATFRNGMYKIENGISQQFTIQKEFGISSNDVRCFVEDNEGSIWLGTFNGLNKIPTMVVSTTSTPKWISFTTIPKVSATKTD